MNAWKSVLGTGLAVALGSPALQAQSTAGEDPAPLNTIAVPQAPPPPPTPSTTRDTGAKLEEVIVSAQRRDESAQEVPISITVFDAKQLANANITNSSDLAAYTPSLSTNQRFGADNATFSIRGFTQELRTTSSVAIYMAEVVAPRGQSSQTSGDGAGPGSMFDLANVQVLKGPQGTLFGRNTTGGAVLLVPNKPSNEFGGYLELTGGEWDARRAQGVINVPVTEHFKTRLAIDRNVRDGYLRNITDIGADHLGSTDYLAGRFSMLWDIGEALQNYTIVSYIDSDSTGYSSQLYACNPNTVTSDFFLAFSGLLQAQPCQQQLDRQKAAGQDGFYDLVSTIKTPVTAIKEKRLINTLSWDINDDLKLKNILAYAHLHTENGSDIFGTQFRYSLAGVPIDPNPAREFKTGISVPNPDIPVTSQKTYVAELQLQGSSFDHALEWQTGVYYEHSLPDGFSGNNSAGLVSCEVATIEGAPSGFNCYDPLAGAVGGVLVQHYKTEYLNRAVYSQTTWHITDEFNLTGGLRYTWDHTEGYGIKTRYAWALATPLAPTEQISSPHTSSKAPTGVLEFDYKPFRGNMAYAKYVRGYRQGSVILAADPGVDTFKPERVDTYEVGIKTQFGGPVPGRFNLSVFYNDFTDQQLQLGYVSPTALQTTTIVNAGKSRIKGIEGEAYFQLLDSLSLALSFSLLDTKLLEQEDQTARVRDAGGPIAGFSVTPIADVGDELPYAPKQSYVASLSWRVPTAAEIGDIDAGVTYSYIGRQRSAASSSGPYGLLDAFSLLNLNLSWSHILASPIDFVMFGTNVLNEKYTTYTSGTYNLLAFESRVVGAPRMIGARLRYNF
ncbi:TonB-dependent Receptor Plug Domain [Solimonas aquatica]|uniref:TonB-dependent Receptor Plug Domain n=1 Tax=Solimonas aquatica TaxID=489703 RepID=A0A1H8ZLW2_9GAMM|nr:TonB-dependent receptor [Solimonas aquatica]SEP65297.1 TonB-dependent Receptor Plug Domain [Solimonas aquatica]